MNPLLYLVYIFLYVQNDFNKNRVLKIFSWASGVFIGISIRLNEIRGNMARAQTIPQQTDTGFITWAEESVGSKEDALSLVGRSYDDNVLTSQGNHQRSFRDIDTNINARTGFTRSDYDFFRSAENVPSRQRELIRKCMVAYSKVGLIKNVIDLMGDFGCQGIQLVHPIPKQQRFFQAWFDKVNGKERSERFLNTLYRAGNVIIKRSTATINNGMYDKMSAIASPDLNIVKDKYISKEIPWRYTFFNPTQVEVLGETIAQFVGKMGYYIRLSHTFIEKFKSKSLTKEEQDLLQQIPKDLIPNIKKDNIVYLDPSKLRVFHYRKDDWQTWADPLIAAILDDIILLEKMKLADSAALDGVISNVRLWRLGNLEQKIFPTKAMVNRLSNILTNNVGGGCMDLVWGPELDFKESATQAHNFLGSEKYQPILNSIYDGLGVPPTLTAAGSAGGFTNNIISIKTLIERLEYGRNLLSSFWNEEIKIVQKAMGFKRPARLDFDHMTLSDEAAEKALLVQLLDRDIISVEAVLDRFNEIPDLEKQRIKREHRDRDKDTMPKKAGPWHNPALIEDLTKIFAQRGSVTPSEVGVELEERKAGEKTQQEQLMELSKVKQSATKQSGGTGGRPKNSKDGGNRTRTVKPRAVANDNMGLISITTWAKSAQIALADILMPGLLAHYDKKNSRQLTDEESNICENIKFSVLCQLEPFQKIDENITANIINTNGSKISDDINSVYFKMIERFTQDAKHKPTTEDLRNIQVLIYSLSHEVDNG